MVIDQYCAIRRQLNSCIRQEGRVGAYSYGKHHRVGFDRAFSCLYFLYFAVSQYAFKTGACHGIDSHIRQMIFHVFLNLTVKSRKHMRRHIDYIAAHAHGIQVLRDLQPDKSASDYNRSFDLPGFHNRSQIYRVVRSPHKEYLRKIQPRQIRPDRRRAGGNHQFIIGPGARLSCINGNCFHRLVCPIDSGYLHARQHLRTGQCLKLFRSVDHQTRAIRNHIPHIIRKSAASIRNILPFRQDYDFCVLVLSFQFRRNLCSCGYASHDDYFHLSLLFLALLEIIYMLSVL